MRFGRLTLVFILTMLLVAACSTSDDDDDNGEATSTSAAAPTPTLAAETQVAETPPVTPSVTPAETATATAPPTEAAPSPTTAPTPTLEPEATPVGPPQVTTFVEGVSMPNALAFTPDGRMFFNEVYDGRIRVVQDGQLLPEPFAAIDVAQPARYTEHGLLGLAIDPDYEQNRFVYAFYTIPDANSNPIGQQIVRFTDQDNIGTEMTVIVDGLPAGLNCCHNGGRIQFGPDGKLYVTLGDVENADTSQRPEDAPGGILRYNPDGTIPEDNPFPGSPTWAYGLRNPFGIRFHPLTGGLFATENGPSGQDELNIIEAGANYGWPIVTGVAGNESFVDPLWVSDGSRAPTGIEIPDSDALPDLRGSVLFCEWLTGTLNVIRLEGPDYNQSVGEETLPLSCQLDVAQGPDGALYLSDQSAIYRYGP